MKKLSCFLALVSIPVLQLLAQNKQLFEKGMQYKAEYKNTEGLAIFQILLKADSSNVDYLSNGSYFYSKVGNRQGTETRKMEYFRKAEYLAKKAIKTNTKDAEAHYAYALALGRLNEHASSKQKIANAKLIKQEAETTIKLDPSHAGAYHILGRWHRTVASFGAIEKIAINAMFGGVPEGSSFEAAISSFEKAIQLEPKYILHYFELAQTYVNRDKSGDKLKAKQYLKKALEFPVTNDDDKVNHQKCEELMKKLS